MNKILLLAALAMVAVFGCKKNPTSTNPTTTPDLFSFKANSHLAYIEFESDSTTSDTVAGSFRFIQSYIPATGLTMFGRTNVTMEVDTFWNQTMDTIKLVDTLYFSVDSAGQTISQYGFISALVSQYSGGLVAIPPQWNLLITQTGTTWITDTTNTSVGVLSVSESTMGTNKGKSTFVVAGTQYDAGVAADTGSAAVAGQNIPIILSVSAIFNPTAIALIITQPTRFLTYAIPKYHRVLTNVGIPG